MQISILHPTFTNFNGKSEGKVLVDSCEGTLEESGELISAGIICEQLMKLGQVLQVETGADEASKSHLMG